MYENIKRIFFDSGKVLVYPKTGNWFFTEKYYNYCESNGIKHNHLMERIIFPFAMKYLNSKNHIENIENEQMVFHKFYSYFFFYQPKRIRNALIDISTNSKVNDPNRYIFYEDVLPTINQLKINYAIGIISDAWPSLKNLYKHHNMLQYFDPFIISTIHGCSKNNGALFKVALENIKEQPNECLFIDDSINNCIQAQKYGIFPVLIDRSNKPRNCTIPVITTLSQIEPLLSS